MRGKDIIVTFNEPWYNKRLYTQLSEQMIREEIERVHKEPIITNTAFDMAVDKAFLELLHDNKDLINITELYKMLLPNISIGDIQFAKIYYYD